MEAYMPIDEIIDNFSYLDEWEDKYRYLIELGKSLEPLPDSAKTEEHKVRGCASQVWLETRREVAADGAEILFYRGDSDAHLVRGLIAVLMALYSGHAPRYVVETDALAVFKQLGFEAHLTPQRSNGLRAMVDRMKNDARATLAA
jgi:cysteine desulfuration protein SufE